LTLAPVGRETDDFTPFADRHTMAEIALSDTLTFRSTGSDRRSQLNDPAAFVLSAEAGLQFSPDAGISVGYEFFRTDTGEFNRDGEEGIFAEFRLRF
ncbi:MAG: hypothetical protein AAF747_09680, partial [Planctomycetota bacterium]